VGSGSGSRYRAGAYIYGGRVLPEGSKSEEKNLTEYCELCLAG
jgi:membrane-bound inhibitor of C-type lysozyme